MKKGSQWNGWEYSRWEFSGWDFPGVNFPGGSLMGGNFPGGNFPRIQQKNDGSSKWWGLKGKWKYILYVKYNLSFSINICSLWIQENLCYNKENWRMLFILFQVWWTLFFLFQVWRGNILFVFGGGMWKKGETRQDGKEKSFRKIPLLGSCPYGIFFNIIIFYLQFLM